MRSGGTFIGIELSRRSAPLAGVRPLRWRVGPGCDRDQCGNSARSVRRRRSGSQRESRHRTCWALFRACLEIPIAVGTCGWCLGRRAWAWSGPLPERRAIGKSPSEPVRTTHTAWMSTDESPQSVASATLRHRRRTTSRAGAGRGRTRTSISSVPSATPTGSPRP